MPKRFINPGILYDPAPLGISQVALDLDGSLIFISDKVDWSNQHHVPSDSVTGQIENVLKKTDIAFYLSLTLLECIAPSENS